MAKITGGLLSLGASGQVGKTLVAASWRGVPYMRRYTIPANPQSTSQMDTRDVFAWLQQVWKLAPTDFQDPWTAFAKGQPLTNRNAFGKANIAPLIGETTLANFIFSSGAAGGVAPASMSVTPGSGSLAVGVTAPTLPVGWTITKAVAAAVRDQDPHSGLLYNITAGEDTTSTYSITLSGLTSSSLYRVGAWLVWAKPDASVAYSASLQSSGTPS